MRYTLASGRLPPLRSHLPALLAAGDVDTSIDRYALHHYMTFHAVVPPPRTILNGVKKLPPATIRIIEADGKQRDRVYWDPPFARDPEMATLSPDDWRDRTLEALRLAVKRRMVSDVPVGVLLSGGVDSSIITGLLAEEGQKDLMTFSIGFEEANGEKGDEFTYSDLIAERFGTDHHKIFVPSSELMSALPDTINAMSEPMVSYDNIGFYLLGRHITNAPQTALAFTGTIGTVCGFFLTAPGGWIADRYPHQRAQLVKVTPVLFWEYQIDYLKA